MRSSAPRAEPLPRYITPGTSLALVAVTVAGVVDAMTTKGLVLTKSALASLFALAALHALLGTVGLHIVERRGVVRRELYAVFACALLVAGAALVVSRGQAFLLVFSLISQSVLYLSAAGVIFVTTLMAATFAWYAPADRWLSEMIGKASGVAFVLAFSQLLLRQGRARAEVERLAAELGEANAQLRAYASDVEELATTKERNRIAREIHDGLGHYLTIVHVQLDAARALLGSNPQGAHQAIAKAQALTREGLDDVRRSVAVLRGSTRGATPAQSLVQAIEKLARESSDEGPRARVEVSGTPRALADELVFTLYRAAQVALTNVRRHAQAQNVLIELAFRGQGQVELRVEDDGVGAANTDGGFGLIGLRERVELSGGTLSIWTAPGQGFKLEVRLRE